MAKEDDQIEVGITFFMIQKLDKTKANKVIDNKKTVTITIVLPFESSLYI